MSKPLIVLTALPFDGSMTATDLLNAPKLAT
jgi:hypothetical protein